MEKMGRRWAWKLGEEFQNWQKMGEMGPRNVSADTIGISDACTTALTTQPPSIRIKFAGPNVHTHIPACA